MLNDQKLQQALKLREFSVALAIVAGFVSLFGVADAYIAADLLVFEALSNLHSVVFGVVLITIAGLSLAGIVLTPETKATQSEDTQSSIQNACSTNSRQNATRIQAMLHVLLYPVVIDGVFGGQTAQMISRFQEDANLKVDAVVGPLTLEALQMQVETIGRMSWVSEIMGRRQAAHAQAASVPMLTLIGAQSSKH